MRLPFSKDFRILVRIVFFMSAGLSVTLLLLRSGFMVYLNHQQKKQIEEWESSGIDFQALPKQFPASKENPEAILMKQFAASIGVDLGKYNDTHDIHPNSKKRAEFRPFRTKAGILQTYLREQYERGDDHLQKVPPQLEQYLQRNRDQLNQIRLLLLKSKAPVWRSDISEVPAGDPGGPLPPLLGLIELHQLFSAECLLCLREGKNDEATMWLQAQLFLENMVVSRPELLCQLIGLSMQKQSDGLLRKWKQPPQIEIHSISKEQMARAFHVEVFTIWNWANRSPLFEQNWFSSFVMKPWVRWGLIDFSKVMRVQLQRMEKADLCDLNPAEFSSDIVPPVSRWNATARAAWFNTTPLYGRFIKARMDRELTERILQMRHTRINDEAKSASKACPSCQWVTRRLDSHRVSIGLYGYFVFPKERDLELPLFHIVSLER